MVRFMIKRGHDGPARRGKLQSSEGTLETPLILGPSDSIDSQLKYATSGSENPREGDYHLQSTGSILVPYRQEEIIPSENTLYMLPSLLGISILPSSTGKQIVQAQLDYLSESKIDPSTAVLQLPSNLDDQELRAMIDRIKSSAIFMASFTFSGDFGPADLDNLRLRAILPRSFVCFAMGRIPPSFVPLLYYLGFDIIDSGYAYEAASKLLRLWHLDTEIMDSQLEQRYCACMHCQNLHRHLIDSDLIEILQGHNMSIYKQVLSSAIHSMARTKLRWQVESMTHAGPELASFLRKVDSQLFPFIEEFTPSHADQKVPLIGPESYHAPIVSRFREYVETRYIPPPEKRIILILPCSARKPYSDSKSHRKFSDVLERAIGPKRDLVAETIVTSPLGVVPRELERIYPAGYYDIPVTGHWDVEETTIAADSLASHLTKFDESVIVIAHVAGGYLDVVRLAEDRIKQTVIYTTHDASPTIRGSLGSLEETLIDIADRYEKPPQRTTLENTVRCTADFMFGPGAGELLVPPTARVGGKVYGSIVCRVDKEQTCMFSGANGSISLTLDGGKRMASLERYWVRFEGSQIEGSSIFAIGIESADPSIRPGDEIMILSKAGEVIGVGRSEMSGPEMCDFTNGIAVKVRHKER